MYIYLENKFNIEDPNMLMMEAEIPTTYIFRDTIYPKVEKVLSTTEGQRKFSKLVSDYINRNNAKLTTIGPVYQIPFTEYDKNMYYELFETSSSELLKTIKHAREEIGTSIPPWQSLSQNPIFCLFFYVIRYFTIHKEPKMLNNALIIMALAIYPSIFFKYFRRYTVNSGVMQYTIDNLSQRFLIKKSNHIFGVLATSVQNSWQYHEQNIIKGSDDGCAQFAWRVHNDQNSLVKRIAQAYNENKNKGLTVSTMINTFDDENINVDEENNSNKVENISNKILTQILINGVDLKLSDFSAAASNISKIELRNYLTKIITDQNSKDMESLIESILFIYLYYEKHTYEEINSKQFISFALSTFKKTNSKEKNINNIKRILDKWGEDSGLYGKFTRLGTRVDYTKGIYLYFIMCIQRYN